MNTNGWKSHFNKLTALLALIVAAQMKPTAAGNILDTSFAVNYINGSVRAIAQLSNGDVMIGGNFTMVNGTTRYYLARVTSTGANSYYGAPTVDGQVYAMAVQPDGKILMGGVFVYVGGHYSPRVARLHSNSSVDTNFFCIGTDASVFALARQPSGMIVIGGDFNYVGPYFQPKLARLKSNGQIAGTYAYANGTVRAIVDDANASKTYVGGDFTYVSGSTCLRLVCLNENGTVDSSFDTSNGFDGPVHALAIRRVDFGWPWHIIAGGAFTSYRGSTWGRERIASILLNGDGSASPNFLTSANDEVRAIAAEADVPGVGQSVIVGGKFTDLRPRLARFIASDLATVGNWNNGPGVGGAGTSVDAICVQSDGKILIGGTFSTVDNLTRNYVARVHPTDYD
jgi:hypothetical protein